MAGIYIHIPFCKQACHYCNFHFSTSLRYKEDLIDALVTETRNRRGYLDSSGISSIYFGGGTPSLLDTADLERILAVIGEIFTIQPGAEITLEANPDDINPGKLASWQKAGINRLSIGVQSFFEEDLLWMNRAHAADQALHCLQQAREYFENITIDLIYGTPGLGDDKWKKNVETAIALGIPHLSCYALTVEPKTPLDKMIRLQQREAVDPDRQSEQFLLLMQWTGAAGYEHYEISNFARPGWRSRHNSAYWEGIPYLGLGPSAHSFNGLERQWNISSNSRYIAALREGRPAYEKELLTPVMRLNEYIMTSLRTMEGLSLEKLANEFSIEPSGITAKAQHQIRGGLLIVEDQALKLTREGKLLADGIAASLFY